MINMQHTLFARWIRDVHTTLNLYKDMVTTHLHAIVIVGYYVFMEPIKRLASVY